MNIGLIIFARFDSSRLYGKALRPVAGRALLARVIDRARQVKGSPKIVIATSDRSLDDPIAALAVEEGAELFRGSATDVAARALAAADTVGLDAFARISGDSPFFDHQLLSDMIDLFSDGGLDLVTNVMPRSFPPGASNEVVAVDAMRQLVAEATEPDEREHVTLYFYRYADRFRIENWHATDNRFDGVRLAVDSAADLSRVDWVAGRLGGRAATAPLEDIVEVARQWQPASNSEVVS